MHTTTFFEPSAAPTAPPVGYGAFEKRSFQVYSVTTAKREYSDRIKVVKVDNSRDHQWVCKSDIRQFWFCPYAFSLVDSGRIDFSALLAQPESTAARTRIMDGQIFERDVFEEMPSLPEGVKPQDLGVRFLYNGPTCEHPGRMIYGRPDGIDLPSHSPIEIKSHRLPTALDRLELAFYWMLLEPSRENANIAPFGWILPRTQSRREDSLVRVELRPQDFREVEELIVGVRGTRKVGVKPRFCRCLVCQTRPEVLTIKRRRRDVRLVSGIGPRHGITLERLEISTVDQLIAANSVDLAQRMREQRRNSVSAKNIVSWQHHGRAFLERRPIRFIEEQFSHAAYIVIDLEYDVLDPGAIWLIGALHRSHAEDEYLQAWCDTPAQRRKGLRRLEALILAHPDLPVITFGGMRADLPQLREACKRLRIDVVYEIESRHVDLYQHLMRSVRFPIPEHGLKELSTYIGAERRSTITGGEDALYAYYRYRDSRSDRVKARLKKKLLAYNREDLQCVAHLITYLPTVTLHPQAAMADVAANQRCPARGANSITNHLDNRKT